MVAFLTSGTHPSPQLHLPHHSVATASDLLRGVTQACLCSTLPPCKMCLVLPKGGQRSWVSLSPAFLPPFSFSKHT